MSLPLPAELIPGAATRARVPEEAMGRSRGGSFEDERHLGDREFDVTIIHIHTNTLVVRMQIGGGGEGGGSWLGAGLVARLQERVEVILMKKG